MSAIRDRSIEPPVPLHATILAAIVSAPPHRRLPVVLCAVLVCAALTLLAIVARSPYTHANLAAGPDIRYERTGQILVGDDPDFAGVSADARPSGADALARGASLYVTAGCAGCHALEGRGGVVGPKLAGIDADTVAARVRLGPVGMPRFSVAGLTAGEVSDIAAYLRSLGTD